MRVNRIWIPAALVLLALTSGTGCLLFPQLKDKVVDLVTSGSVSSGFSTFGHTNVFSQTRTVNIRDSLDIRQVLDNAGIDVMDVKAITLGGVSYRITRAEPGRVITSGDVQIRRDGEVSFSPLVTSFTGSAGAVTGWITPPLDTAGVRRLNNLLGEILTELQDGAQANEVFDYTVNGVSTPAGDTDFDYELRITISIVGEVKTKWLE